MTAPLGISGLPPRTVHTVQELSELLEACTPEEARLLLVTRKGGAANGTRDLEVRILSVSLSGPPELTLLELTRAIEKVGQDGPVSEGPDGNRSVEVVPLSELERRAILGALRHTEGNVGRAAKLLGIGRATLYRRLATLELWAEVAASPRAP